MKKHVAFHAEVRAKTLVELRWDHDFGRHGLPIYQAMSTEFDAIHGVEKVVMGRYSANIIVAAHVASAESVVAAAAEAISDQNIAGALRMFASEIQVTVDVFLTPTLRI